VIWQVAEDALGAMTGMDSAQAIDEMREGGDSEHGETPFW
jgi:hypothetical protein